MLNIVNVQNGSKLFREALLVEQDNKITNKLVKRSNLSLKIMSATGDTKALTLFSDGSDKLFRQMDRIHTLQTFARIC